MSVWVGLDIGSRNSIVGVRKGGRPAGQWDIAQTPAGRK
ncbi:IS110 family transposase, partial [Pantoea sp. Ap-967]|nr:IS110 family transposase [Pantoea sp. Ap-967]NIE78644.1 IS110 family transposase [Pantoea sp. Ap-967]